jgi:hypothetical protein
MRALRWLSARLKDLLYDPSNCHLDPGRVTGWLTIITIIVAALWNIHLGKEIDLGVTGLPGGLAALLGAAVVYLIKDRQQAAGNAS